MVFPDLFVTMIAGFLAALVASLLIVLSKKYHGRLTTDSVDGIQKFHSAPTPRVGGVAILIGYIVVWFFLDQEVRQTWAYIGIAGLPAFLFGIAEDISGNVSVKLRLFATIFAGLVFATLSGYSITAVDLWGFDYLLSFSIISLAFTAFAVGGVANAVNIIDGFHGLASGTLVLILCSFAMVAWRVGDDELLVLSVSMASLVCGFMVVNFPFGKLFLGDAGAYFSGFVVAILAVMLPARNPELSPWLSLLILWYPITETLVSIFRKTVDDELHPGDPDSSHLHQLVYRSFAKRIAASLGLIKHQNPIAGLLMWGFSILTLLFSAASSFHIYQVAGFLVCAVSLYIVIYRLILLGEKPAKDR